MGDFPDGVLAYKKTPVFTEETVPAGLLKLHRTKAGVWAKIVVLKGRLEYSLSDGSEEAVVLTPEVYGVIEPAVYHRVRPLGCVEFYVEFMKK